MNEEIESERNFNNVITHIKAMFGYYSTEKEYQENLYKSVFERSFNEDFYEYFKVFVDVLFKKHLESKGLEEYSIDDWIDFIVEKRAEKLKLEQQYAEERAARANALQQHRFAIFGKNKV